MTARWQPALIAACAVHTSVGSPASRHREELHITRNIAFSGTKGENE